MAVEREMPPRLFQYECPQCQVFLLASAVWVFKTGPMKYLSGFLLGLVLLVSGCKSSTGTGNDYLVISLTTSPRKECKVISKGDVYAAIYSKRYGPETKANCEKWIQDNCDQPAK
jgi:hypothetical protein